MPFVGYLPRNYRFLLTRPTGFCSIHSTPHEHRHPGGRGKETEMGRHTSAAIGFVIAAIGMGACVAMAAIDHLLLTYGPDIRGFLLWMCDPRAAIGMAFGMVVMAGIAWCALAEIGGEA